MNNLLEQFNTNLKRLQNEGLNRRDKEMICEMVTMVNGIIGNIEEELTRLRRLYNTMSDSRSFSRGADDIYPIVRSKNNELEAWNTVRNTMRRLMQ